MRRGLTFTQAEELLDRLEASGIGQREMRIEADGVTVSWRGWPRSLGSQEQGPGSSGSTSL
jgi:hypothetical protein